MDKIPDAEYKVVEHQIAPPLDPSPRWRFQQLSLQMARTNEEQQPIISLVERNLVQKH